MLVVAVVNVGHEAVVAAGGTAASSVSIRARGRGVDSIRKENSQKLKSARGLFGSSRGKYQKKRQQENLLTALEWEQKLRVCTYECANLRQKNKQLRHTFMQQRVLDQQRLDSLARQAAENITAWQLDHKQVEELLIAERDKVAQLREKVEAAAKERSAIQQYEQELVKLREELQMQAEVEMAQLRASLNAEKEAALNEAARAAEQATELAVQQATAQVEQLAQARILLEQDKAQAAVAAEKSRMRKLVKALAEREKMINEGVQQKRGS